MSTFGLITVIILIFSAIICTFNLDYVFPPPIFFFFLGIRHERTIWHLYRDTRWRKAPEPWVKFHLTFKTSCLIKVKVNFNILPGEMHVVSINSSGEEIQQSCSFTFYKHLCAKYLIIELFLGMFCYVFHDVIWTSTNTVC